MSTLSLSDTGVGSSSGLSLSGGSYDLGSSDVSALSAQFDSQSDALQPSDVGSSSSGLSGLWSSLTAAAGAAVETATPALVGKLFQVSGSPQGTAPSAPSSAPHTTVTAPAIGIIGILALLLVAYLVLRG